MHDSELTVSRILCSWQFKQVAPVLVLLQVTDVPKSKLPLCVRGKVIGAASIMVSVVISSVMLLYLRRDKLKRPCFRGTLLRKPNRNASSINIGNRDVVAISHD